MVTNAANARIFGSDLDAVNIGLLTAALPVDLAPLPEDGPFTDVGWLHSDGIPFTPEDSVEKIRGHQGGRVVRTTITESDLTFQFQALESTALTLALQHNVTDSAVEGEFARLTASAGRPVVARKFVIDLYDKDDTSIQYRYLIERGEIGERSEFTHANSDITGYTFQVEVIGSYQILTNDPGVVDGIDVTPGS